MSVVKSVFGLLETQPVNQVPSTEQTIIYSNVVVSCSCHSFPKPVQNPVLYCAISQNKTLFRIKVRFSNALLVSQKNTKTNNTFA